MRFPIVIHKDSCSGYGVTVPDLPGCFSAGDTLDHAIESAREAIACHIEGLLMDGEPVPLRASIEEHQANEDYRGGVWAIVARGHLEALQQEPAHQHHVAGASAGHRGSGGGPRRAVALRPTGARGTQLRAAASRRDRWRES